MHEAVKCENCCYWKPSGAPMTYGDCYRDPPTVIGLDRCFRPETQKTDRCASWTQSGPMPREVELERKLNDIRKNLDAGWSAEIIVNNLKMDLDAHGFRGQRTNDHSEGETGPCTNE